MVYIPSANTLLFPIVKLGVDGPFIDIRLHLIGSPWTDDVNDLTILLFMYMYMHTQTRAHVCMCATS